MLQRTTPTKSYLTPDNEQNATALSSSSRRKLSFTYDNHHSLAVNFEFPTEADSDGTLSDDTNKTSEPQQQQQQQGVAVHERSDFPFLVAGACFLTFVSGYINATAFLSGGRGVTHATGSTTHLGISTVAGDSGNAWYIAAVLGSFLLGAVTCNTVGGYGSEKFVMRRSNGVFLVVIGVVLTIGLTLDDSRLVGHSLLSFSNGMQNALCTSFSGAVIRTTHVTGMLTDIGISLGHYFNAMLRGTLHTDPPPDTWKLTILIPQYTSFFLGSLLSAYMYSLWGVQSGYIASCPVALLGVAYLFASTRGAFDEIIEEELAEQQMETIERRFSLALHTAMHQHSPKGSFVVQGVV